MKKSCSNTNKKRNVGLTYEFLLRTISRSLVENNTKNSSSALNILKENFKQGTEIYREFRLFNSLLKTTVTSESVASSIMFEAKNAIRNIDSKKLEKEKTYVIHEINKLINDDTFYDQPISEYKVYSTIGTLFNAWRNPNKHDLSKVAEYEEKLIEWLKTKKDVTSVIHESHETPGMNRLVFKLMTKKLNDKYGTVLNEEQKSIVREYALYSMTGSDANLKNKLGDIKEKFVAAIKSYNDELPGYTHDKLNQVCESLLKENNENIDDELIAKYMSYSKLVNELATEEEK